MLDSLFQLDGQLLVAIQGLHMSWLDPVVSFYTKLGDAGLIWISLALGMLFYKPTRRAGALALCSMILGLLVTNLTLKPLVERARPWLDWPIIPLVTEKDPNSFPSGHTCAAFAAAMIWVRTLPRRSGRIIAAAAAVLMGLSRLYVGVHYPSDVLAGAVIGSLCAWIVWRVYQIYYRSKTNLQNEKER